MIFGLCFLGFLFSSNEFGRAAFANWGNTGAPGDQELPSGEPRTCISCHNTGAIQVTLDIFLRDTLGNEIVDEYIPGQTYEVEVVINNPSPPVPLGYGFQMIALDDATESEINTWTEDALNVKLSTASNTGRTYVEQAGASGAPNFLMQWTAPEQGTGSVTFYSCGNGVNGTGSSGGDGAACNTLTLQEGEISSNNELFAKSFNLKLSPNPTSHFLKLDVDSNKSAEYKIDLLSTQGEVVRSTFVDFHAGANSISFDVANLPTGMYFVQLQNLRSSVVYKWMKL